MNQPLDWAPERPPRLLLDLADQLKQLLQCQPASLDHLLQISNGPEVIFRWTDLSLPDVGRARVVRWLSLEDGEERLAQLGIPQGVLEQLGISSDEPPLLLQALACQFLNPTLSGLQTWLENQCLRFRLLPVETQLSASPGSADLSLALPELRLIEDRTARLKLLLEPEGISRLLRRLQAIGSATADDQASTAIVGFPLYWPISELRTLRKGDVLLLESPHTGADSEHAHLVAHVGEITAEDKPYRSGLGTSHWRHLAQIRLSDGRVMHRFPPRGTSRDQPEGSVVELLIALSQVQLPPRLFGALRRGDCLAEALHPLDSNQAELRLGHHRLGAVQATRVGGRHGYEFLG